MFSSLVANSLKHRLFVLATALVLVVYGSITLPLIPVDVFPDLNRPSVTLMTEAEGLAPQEVEQLVTFPIETAMNGMPGVVRVRSVSGIGLSIVFDLNALLLGISGGRLTGVRSGRCDITSPPSCTPWLHRHYPASSLLWVL
jgi:hypothetical protein